MYSYEWDKQARGYRLKTCASNFGASEIRPVFCEELTLTGPEERLKFDKKALKPLLGQSKMYTYTKVKKWQNFVKHVILASSNLVTVSH